jgi:FMN reductase
MSDPVVLVSGSPARESRSTGVLRALDERLARAGLRSRAFGLHDFAASDLVLSNTDANAVKQYLASLHNASVVVFGTPVYKATYSGGLKLLIDLIPPDALRGKTVLAVATARVSRYFQGVQRAFDDLYRFFDVGLTIPPIFMLDEQVSVQRGVAQYDKSAEAALDKAAVALVSALGTARGAASELRASRS